MDETFRLLARNFDGAKIAGLYRAFGISRVTGHETIKLCKHCGIQVSTGCSRRLHFGWSITAVRDGEPNFSTQNGFSQWGAPKIESTQNARAFSTAARCLYNPWIATAKCRQAVDSGVATRRCVVGGRSLTLHRSCSCELAEYLPSKPTAIVLIDRVRARKKLSNIQRNKRRETGRLQV
jgi:hypothetical protein